MNMKKCLFCMAFAIVLNATGLKAADVLTLGNTNFETAWTGLTDYGTPDVILKKVTTIASDVTGWTGDAGNGGLVIYQGLGHTGSNAAVLINVHATGGCRFYNNSVLKLTKGSQYKLTFYAKGSATIGNVSLFQSGARPTVSQATSGNAGGVYDVSKVVNSPISLGDTWTKMEYNYTVPAGSAYTDYKLYFTFYGCTSPALDGSNLSSAFMIDDITFEPYVDNTITTLSELRVKGSLIDNYISTNLNYTLTLPSMLTIPPVTAVPTDSRATIVVANATNLSGTEAERTATITVTAADGVTQKTYTVIFTMTTDLIREGFASTDLPSSYTFSNSGADWRIDATHTNSNGMVWGMNSLRTNGGTITAANFTINNIENSGILSFYLKQRDIDAAGKLTVLYQYTTDPVDQWTELVNYTTFPLAFELKSIELNKTATINLKFDVIKTSALSPFNMDDIVINPKSINSISNNSFSKSIHITNLENGISIYTEGFAKYSVTTITGQLVLKGTFTENTTLQLNAKGTYLVSVGNAQEIFTQKILHY